MAPVPALEDISPRPRRLRAKPIEPRLWQVSSHRAGDDQGDPGGGLPRPARRGGGDDPEPPIWILKESGLWPAEFWLEG